MELSTFTSILYQRQPQGTRMWGNAERRRRSAALQPCPTSGHGGQKSSEDKSISIHDCAVFATHPQRGEYSRPPGGSGCHNSAGLRSSPASLWEGVSKFHYPPRCRRARLARSGSKVRADRSARFPHLLKRAVLAARLLSLFTQVLCLEYCIFSCSQCISPPYLSGGFWPISGTPQ